MSATETEEWREEIEELWRVETRAVRKERETKQL